MENNNKDNNFQPKKISTAVERKLDELAEQGNTFFDYGKLDEALKVWSKGLEMIPEPHNCYAESVWFLASIGDIWFSQREYKKALECFEAARTNLSGEGLNNPFILLRTGQCCFETGDVDAAAEFLLSAYMLEGEEIFDEDNEKYFEFLQNREELD